MSEINLSETVAVDPALIASAKLLKKGAKIGEAQANEAAPDAEKLTAPEDELIVVLQDGTGFAIRGERDAKQAWDTLERARKEGNLNFQMTLADAR